MPDKNDKAYPSLTYDSLTELQQGFAESLVEFESANDEDLGWENDDEGEDVTTWGDITVHDFSRRSLKTIVEDCDRFVAAIVGENRASWDALFPGVSDHDLGWYLYLDRQGPASAWTTYCPRATCSIPHSGPAGNLGAVMAEIGDDGRIHIETRSSTSRP